MCAAKQCDMVSYNYVLKARARARARGECADYLHGMSHGVVTFYQYPHPY